MTAPLEERGGGPPAPGQVWWCDGGALAFEAHFKRRPVLVLGVRAAGAAGEAAATVVLVAPLSSRRRFGQEQAVTHDGGVSYLAGGACAVPASALLKPLGAWDGFAAWSAAQNAPPEPPPWRRWLRRLLPRIYRSLLFLGNHPGIDTVLQAVYTLEQTTMSVLTRAAAVLPAPFPLPR